MALIELTKQMSEEDLKSLQDLLKSMDRTLDKLLDEQRRMNNEIQTVKYRIDNHVKDEFNTLERKYIAFLEGKLIQFDQEVNELRKTTEAEYRRMHEAYFQGTR